jgi:hypothetical protein
MSLSSTISCVGNTGLRLHQRAVFMGEEAANITSIITKKGTELEIKTTGSTFEGPVNELVICE